MTGLVGNIWSRLVIVEGIMGSGKSTTVLRLADRLKASGISASGITEGVSPHPIRFDWDVPWADMPATQLAESAVARWRAYANSASPSESMSVVDGQLFHGNLTSLFLLDADVALIRGYLHDVAAAIKQLRPLLIYFHQDDIDRAIRMIATERGDAWVRYQVDWKLAAPYAVKHGFAGLEGLIELYRNYRRLTDQLYADLDIAKISIENSGREWAKYEATIDSILMNPYGTAEVANLSRR
jgi:molybdopterin-guanine dinucleotide biosynthesis protein